MDIPTLPPTEEDLRLVEFARRIVEENGDGEVHTVGAAVRDARGRVFGGINVYHFTGGPCAELVALGHARAAGARELTTIVAVGGQGRGVLAPCGRDRQILLDHHPRIRILIDTAEGVRSVAIGDLLPWAYVWAGHAGAAGQEPAAHAEAAGRDPAAVPSLHFHRDYLDAVRAGTKVTTIRFRDPGTIGPVNLVFELDEEVTLPGLITEVVGKRVAELTEADAVADGFRELAELQARLRYHYPEIQPTDEIVIVHFRLT
ncbi:ASCH domain-containing protein [Actinoallomurus sp. NPDC052308]|uniref:ASCH domain-containing protein n=1 Tax=Actinoallomurus sp. NPDC052308 TaxID=3155530 RepID=UPI003442C656